MIGYVVSYREYSIASKPVNPTYLALDKAVNIEEFATSIIVGERLQEASDCTITIRTDIPANIRKVIMNSMNALLEGDHIFIITNKTLNPVDHTIEIEGVELLAYLLNRKATHGFIPPEQGNILGNVLKELEAGYEAPPIEPRTPWNMAKMKTTSMKGILRHAFIGTTPSLVPGEELEYAMLKPIKEDDNISDWLFDNMEDLGFALYCKSYLDLADKKDTGLGFSTYTFQLDIQIKRLDSGEGFGYIDHDTEGVKNYTREEPQKTPEPSFKVTYYKPTLKKDSAKMETEKKEYTRPTLLHNVAPWELDQDETLKVDTNIFYNSEVESDGDLFARGRGTEQYPVASGKFAKLVLQSGLFNYAPDDNYASVLPFIRINDATDPETKLQYYVATIRGFSDWTEASLITPEVSTEKGHSILQNETCLFGWSYLAGTTETTIPLYARAPYKRNEKLVYSYYLGNTNPDARIGLPLAYVLKSDWDKYAIGGTRAKQILSPGFQILLAEQYLWNNAKQARSEIEIELDESLSERIQIGAIIVTPDRNENTRQVVIEKVHSRENGEDKYDVKLAPLEEA